MMALMVLQRLVRDFYKILNEVKTGEVPADLKLPDSFDKLISDMQTNQYDAKTFAFMLRGMVSCLLHLT
jgi:alpha-1,4-galacturonosyltransferase